MAELERISGMTFEEAKNILLTNVEQKFVMKRQLWLRNGAAS